MNLAYFAGFFDGEGCIFIHTSRQKKGKIQLQIRVSVVNTHPAVLNELARKFGGSIRMVKFTKKNWRQRFIWEAVSKTAAEFLETIFPYLVVKKEQADLALIFQQGIKKNKKLHLTEKEKNTRLDIKRKISELNNKEYLTN